MTRLSHPDLHPLPEIPRTHLEIEIEDPSSTAMSNSESASQQSVSPSPGGRSRYSQPNLTSFLGPYTESRRADRRFRMSQPTLCPSNFPITLDCAIGARQSFSSLQEEERLNSKEPERGSLISPRLSRVSRSNIQSGRRERLSQPTLVTGDYYPVTISQQRLSQPSLGVTERDLASFLRSPTFAKQKRIPGFSTSPLGTMQHISKRERLSQLDFGSVARYRVQKDWSNYLVQFNRDRFSIPELETKNDLAAMAGTPKQRFSLDSQLNPPSGRRRSSLLPIASSPIEMSNQNKLFGVPQNLKAKSPTVEGLENVLKITTTPILHPSDKNVIPYRKNSTNLPITPPMLLLPKPPPRERLSVPEIRSASLRRLLDPPILKQRHSITACTTRQNSLSLALGKVADKNARMSVTEEHSIVIETFGKKENRGRKLLLGRKESADKKDFFSKRDSTKQNENTVKEEPVHIQRHFAYTYETETKFEGGRSTTGLAKVNKVTIPKKKYLESNFDENEKVITTVIETECPLILSSPKYTKKTHAYASEPPKWMKKYLTGDTSPKTDKNSPTSDGKKIDTNFTENTKKAPQWPRSTSTSLRNKKGTKAPYIRLETADNYENSPTVCQIVTANWPESSVLKNERRSDGDTDTDSEPSTSI
ncbi:uncharacterized protein LOC122506181 [Leptopilina heterotoma]|uniref:uncharacterized protein LOC122506181 n=1 Tax=Leptopilina heterotoma TaxID=63436 RepID=UPI001CA982F7|nr:uncharacterized protein LOC122506181 [Leptopilina heterotoma]